VPHIQDEVLIITCHIKKQLKGLSVFLWHMIRNIVDLDNVLTILIFIALNNCLGNMGKVVFFRGFKCHLSID
jgi:hypothetical protein